MRKIILSRLAAIAVIAAAATGLAVNASSAETFYQSKDFVKSHCTGSSWVFAVEPSGAYSCVRTDEGMSMNCTASGQCALVDTRRASGPDNRSPRGDGKK
jgi:hypothetical protein